MESEKKQINRNNKFVVAGQGWGWEEWKIVQTIPASIYNMDKLWG